MNGGFSVNVLAARGMPSVLVSLAGEIDLMAFGALSEVVERLSTVAPASVMIDLAEVTFASSTLPNFLARLHRNLPAHSTVWLCRPTTRTRRLLEITGMDEIATLRPDLPRPGKRLTTGRR